MTSSVKRRLEPALRVRQVTERNPRVDVVRAVHGDVVQQQLDPRRQLDVDRRPHLAGKVARLTLRAEPGHARDACGGGTSPPRTSRERSTTARPRPSRRWPAGGSAGPPASVDHRGATSQHTATYAATLRRDEQPIGGQMPGVEIAAIALARHRHVLPPDLDDRVRPQPPPRSVDMLDRAPPARHRPVVRAATPAATSSRTRPRSSSRGGGDCGRGSRACTGTTTAGSRASRAARFIPRDAARLPCAASCASANSIATATPATQRRRP